MSLISDIATGGIGSIIDAVGKVASDMITTDKERAAAQIEQERLGLDRDKAYLGDTQDARHMQASALQQDDLFAKRFIYWFAIGWSVFSMAFFLAITFVDIPKGNIRVVDTILGFLLGTAIASIFNFFLGTTVRSGQKDSTIQSLVQK